MNSRSEGQTAGKGKAPASMERYFAGSALYGDDFDGLALAAWYAAEREGYASEVLGRQELYRYKYHAINQYYGFSHLKGRRDLQVLGLGSAYGDELLPIASLARRFDVVEPSDVFFDGNRSIGGVPAAYHKPEASGRLEFEESRFDVVTSFGVLHHIANVSRVVRECQRVLKPGGLFLCREPIVSMGDWRRPRRGLTRNERGIPYDLFMKILSDAELEVRKASLFDFSPFVRLLDNFGVACFGNLALTRIDRLLSMLFAFNLKYHRRHVWQKFGPASVFVVAAKAN